MTPIQEQLQALIEQGLLFSEALAVFGEHLKDEDPESRFYRTACEDQTEDLEIDGSGIISRSDDGAWVLAWIWVSNSEAGVEEPEDDEEKV